MNLSSMMYRLNVQQQQQQQQQQSQKQQSPHAPQQTSTITVSSLQQQSQSGSAAATTQVIPSHILLQQQLAAAAAAAAATNASLLPLHVSSTASSSGSTGGNAATEHIGGLNSGGGGNLQPQRQNLQQPQQPQQQQHAHAEHMHSHTHALHPRPHSLQHHAQPPTLQHVAGNVIPQTSGSSNIVVASSVEEKLKLLSTAIKSEPLSDVIALTTAANNNNSSNNNGTSGSNNSNNIKSSSNSNNNNNSSSTNSASNIIALSVTSITPNVSASKSTTSGLAPFGNTSLSLSLSPSPAAIATAPATSGSNLHNANTINLVVGAGNAGIPAANAASSTSAAAGIATGGGATGSISASGGGCSLNSGAGAASGNPTGTVSNGHLVFVPSKRARLEGPDDWISTSSPGSVPGSNSAPPLSPSPGPTSQSHSYSANVSNGYASPMSAGSYDPYSPNGKTGRDDLSPSSSLNGYSANEGCDAKKSKKGPAPRLQEELCLVCGDRASGYHYNALTCEGCKGFFRRSVTKNAVYCCKFGHACEMDMYMRRKCQECRLKKCLTVGMRPECVVPETQCAMKRREKKAQKEKDKQQASPATCTTDFIKKEVLELMTCEPPTHQTCPILPEDILMKCKSRNIPPLTYNQLAVIYKLIWYQDGYEQPSEEDLKRIMSTPDENESQHDISFRHITEITILTVQLIVEFAKGLPAFTKIPQEDQITLLKACSSEVMMLRMARRYDCNSDSIFFANNRSYTRDAYKMAGVADNIEDLLHFCRQMYSMKVDNVEYALLTAIVIFSDRPGLEEAELVEAIQSYYIDTLRIYILNRHCGDPKSLVFFAKLLSILTELRTLGNQNAEMCFSLKLKNRKLPKFLEEIWDVHAIPPSVQSHIQATQAEKAMQESAAASTSAQAAAASIVASSSTATSAAASSTSMPLSAVVAGATSAAVTATGSVYTPSPSLSMMGLGALKQEHQLGGENSSVA